MKQDEMNKTRIRILCLDQFKSEKIVHIWYDLYCSVFIYLSVNDFFYWMLIIFPF
jgi:hypothetical protein